MPTDPSTFEDGDGDGAFSDRGWKPPQTKPDTGEVKPPTGPGQPDDD